MRPPCLIYLATSKTINHDVLLLILHLDRLGSKHMLGKVLPLSSSLVAAARKNREKLFRMDDLIQILYLVLFCNTRYW